MIEAYLARRGDRAKLHDILFVSASGRPIAREAVANLLKQIARRAGVLRHVTPHMVRHTIATLLFENGADIRIVQEFLGHASLSTTQRYTHVSKQLLVSRLRATHPGLVARAGDSDLTQ